MNDNVKYCLSCLESVCISRCTQLKLSYSCLRQIWSDKVGRLLSGYCSFLTWFSYFTDWAWDNLYLTKHLVLLEWHSSCLGHCKPVSVRHVFDLASRVAGVLLKVCVHTIAYNFAWLDTSYLAFCVLSSALCCYTSCLAAEQCWCAVLCHKASV